MENCKRVRFWDNDTGSDYLAEWVSEHWVFWEREWGGVRWYEVPATEKLLRKVSVGPITASPIAA